MMPGLWQRLIWELPRVLGKCEVEMELARVKKENSENH